MMAWHWWDAGAQPAIHEFLSIGAVAICGGLAWGTWMWWYLERRYQR
jgi:hypothetical protein